MSNVKITPKKKEALNQLDLFTYQDIIEHYPVKYDEVIYIAEEDWEIDSKVIFEATINSPIKMSRFKGNMSVIYFNVETKKNEYRISIFNRPWLMKLKAGQLITIIGKYEGQNKVLAYNIDQNSLESHLGIHPIYSLKDKLTDKYFNGLVNDILDNYPVKDFIPEYIVEEKQLASKNFALKQIHNPNDKDNLALALKTLKYEEFLKFNLLMQAKKKDNSIIDEGYKKSFDINNVNEFINNLPFSLTDDQKKVVEEISNDLASNKQMNRLLQGDVGSGKTIVSFIAMYMASLANYQAALMAPTEILAKQHYKNMQKIFAGYDVKIAILHSSMSNNEKNTVLQGITNGEIDLVVGTHSLFQDAVNFKRLGLVITDEQQRFGVKQRKQLALKGEYVDVLLMSATPIPRTLAISLYGDLDVSTITSTPNNKKVIHSKYIAQNSFKSVYTEILDLLRNGNQMYIVCASIESNMNCRNVNDVYDSMVKLFGKEFKVGILHGQLDQIQKNEVEEKFAKGQIDILVATTVVEVGVDVKNANIMVIYDANHFGLSQLHQLRGRIGRGDKEGYCYFLSDSDEPEAKERLEYLASTTNGFEISNYDLILRGPGDLLGFKQSGIPEFVLGNIVNDNDILNITRDYAKEIINNLAMYPIISQYIANCEDVIC